MAKGGDLQQEWKARLGPPEVQASGSRGTGAAEQVSRETDHSSREWGYSQPQGTMGYSQT